MIIKVINCIIYIFSIREVFDDSFLEVVSFYSYVLKVPFEGSGSGIVYIWIGRYLIVMCVCAYM